MHVDNQIERLEEIIALCSRAGESADIVMLRADSRLDALSIADLQEFLTMLYCIAQIKAIAVDARRETRERTP
jgi:hypothetical protein